MTDRELLEFAAKAAGFGDPEKGRTCWTESEYPRGSGQKGALWNYVDYITVQRRLSEIAGLYKTDDERDGCKVWKAI